MGHIQPDGAVAGEDAVWDAWRRLTRAFRTSRLIWAAIRSGAAWGVYGVDLVTTFARTPMARDAREITDALSAVDFTHLIGIAAVNAQRNDAMWRLAVIFYVTVPGSLLLASLDFSPEIIREMVQTAGPVLIALFLLFSGQMLFYFGAWWRARQIVAALELVALSRARGVSPES